MDSTTTGDGPTIEGMTESTAEAKTIGSAQINNGTVTGQTGSGTEAPTAIRSDESRYFLVREDILPEALVKTIQAKQMLASGKAKTVHEAADRCGLSRSAFYKYKDGIHPLSKLDRERIVTISMDLQHRSGILSKVLAIIAGLDGNVLTIHQTIPLQGTANVVLSVETSHMGENVIRLLDAIRGQDGVSRATVIGQG
ncbi:MAG: hypothetical protein K0Q81_455 [Paenibacillus sp.]|jgi:chorismate mutase|nr:hypothetical protein [Paenibacillus sp.]